MEGVQKKDELWEKIEKVAQSDAVCRQLVVLDMRGERSREELLMETVLALVTIVDGYRQALIHELNTRNKPMIICSNLTHDHKED